MIKFYKTLSKIILNTLLFVIVINLIANFYIKQKNKSSDEIEFLYSVINHDAYLDADLEISLDSSYVNDVINDYISLIINTKKEFEYHPITEHQHGINVTKTYNFNKFSDFNTRLSICDANAKKIIFCFGGSTTLGIFNDDSHTWPAFLNQLLNLNSANNEYCVINFGTGGFTPTQETNLFLYLIKQGYRPSLSIFMDGVNTGPIHDGSEFSSRISERFNFNGYSLSNVIDALYQMPVLQLIRNDYKKKYDLFKTDNYDIAEIEFSNEYNDLISNRFIENAILRNLIANEFDIDILQFLQPNGYINHPEEKQSWFGKKYLKSTEGLMLKSNMTQIYEKVLRNEKGYIDLSYLFDTYKHTAITDVIHYSPDFNLYLAKDIINYFPKQINNYYIDSIRISSGLYIPKSDISN